MRWTVHLGIQECEIMARFGTCSYKFVIFRVIGRFRSYKLRFEWIKTSFWRSELLVNIRWSLAQHSQTLSDQYGKNDSHLSSENTLIYGEETFLLDTMNLCNQVSRKCLRRGIWKLNTHTFQFQDVLSDHLSITQWCYLILLPNRF